MSILLSSLVIWDFYNMHTSEILIKKLLPVWSVCVFASIIVNVKKVLCDGNGEEIFFAIDMTQNLKPSP